MNSVVQIKNQLISKIPASYRKRLGRATEVFASYLPKSLKPPYPHTITIDPLDSCNLKCPLCPSGLGILNDRPTVMSIDTFKLIVRKIPRIDHLCLFNWGEPFLNPAVFKMIRYAAEKNIGVTIHSNFSLKKHDDFFINILESGLDTLVISLDGTSPQSYSRYRIGGDFNLVLSNIKKLVKMKKDLGYKSPLIIWKFIVNRFNENEIAHAKYMANQLGIEFETSCLGLSDDLPGVTLADPIQQRKRYWLPENKKYRHLHYRNEYKKPLMNSSCPQLFETMVINPDGKVFPCCWVTNWEHAFGDLKKESFEDIWHNSKYRYSRSLFSKEEYYGPDKKTVCSFCNNYRKVRAS
jgi:radical SAM protein with 4Fe4S-binding SPASM domain